MEEGGNPNYGVRPHIAMVISTMAAGGAERVISILGNHWVGRGFKVSIITLSCSSADHYVLSPEICRVKLNLMGDSANYWQKLKNNIRRLREIRGSVRKLDPDVVISFIEDTNIRVMLALTGMKVPVIVSERTDPRHYDVGGLRRGLRRWLYRHAQEVVVQTESVRFWALDFLRAGVVHVIPNPVTPWVGDAEVKAISLANGRNIFAMGRMCREKGFDLLVEAYAKSGVMQRGWKLVILGDGRERQALKDMAGRLGVSGGMEMPGTVREPRAWFRAGGVFVLSSRFEGFPNALLEAMAEGLPCIAFDCESGPNEIIRKNVDGLLVPAGDVDAMATAIERLASDEQLRAKLAQRTSEVLQRFSLERIASRWEDLFIKKAGNEQTRNRS
jgi:glycosyltransferase involved in cell wall biosynthesis